MISNPDKRRLAVSVAAVVASLMLRAPLVAAMQLHGHTPATVVAQMGPRELVDEYCKEYYHHGFWHEDYIKNAR